MTKRFLFSILVLIVLFLFAIFAPMLSPFDPQFIDVSNKLQAPDSIHWLGTDQLGRDVASRLIYGTRYSLFLAISISILEGALGIVFGLLIGWYQGNSEKVFLWFANIMSAFPSFLLSLATVSILGQGMKNLILSIVIIEWIFYARVVINLVKTAKEEAFVMTAKMMGLSTWHILKTHIFPFIYKPILVMLLMNVGNVILMISGFSFLGVGVQPSMAEWGLMLHDARAYFRTATWMMVSPGVAIFLTVIAFNLFSEEIEENRRKAIWEV